MTIDDTYLAIVSLAAGSLLTVMLGIYLPLTNRFMRWYARGAWRRVQLVTDRSPSISTAYFVNVGDAAVAVMWRLMLATYLVPLLLIIVPMAFAIMAFMLSVALIHPA
jgi:hypothetical protein